LPADGAERGAIGTAEITDFGISVRHLDRLLDGLLLATSPRVDWAKLLRRTYATDVLACAPSGGRLRLLSHRVRAVRHRRHNRRVAPPQRQPT
jgi:hypothetical protein